jgi:medium-chain acyl-[acyl-carrier-protein] hydrolase
MRLFCIPYAGGAAQTFRKWPAHLPASVELCAIQLPGRETRLRETPFSEVHALVGSLVPALLPYLDRPFALFGHSMGALVAYAAARLLQEEFELTPEQLVVSGRVAPHCALARPAINALPQAEFIEGLRQLNGTSPDILADASLMAAIGPMLRADFALNEEYIHRPGPRLQCDVLAFGGLRDAQAGRAGLNAWAQVTAGAFSLRMLPGDHFFIQSAQSTFLRMLAMELYEMLGSTIHQREARA